MKHWCGRNQTVIITAYNLNQIPQHGSVAMCSSSTYQGPAEGLFANPLHGSVGIVQVQPRKYQGDNGPQIPQTAVWGFVQVQPKTHNDSFGPNARLE